MCMRKCFGLLLCAMLFNSCECAREPSILADDPAGTILIQNNCAFAQDAVSRQMHFLIQQVSKEKQCFIDYDNGLREISISPGEKANIPVSTNKNCAFSISPVDGKKKIALLGVKSGDSISCKLVARGESSL